MGTLNVVDINLIAKHTTSADIGAFYRRSSKSNEGRIRECISAIFGEAIGRQTCFLIHLCLESVLTSMCFVSDNDDVSSIRKQRMDILPIIRNELLDRCKGQHPHWHASACLGDHSDPLPVRASVEAMLCRLQRCRRADRQDRFDRSTPQTVGFLSSDCSISRPA